MKKYAENLKSAILMAGVFALIAMGISNMRDRAMINDKKAFPIQYEQSAQSGTIINSKYLSFDYHIAQDVNLCDTYDATFRFRRDPKKGDLADVRVNEFLSATVEGDVNIQIHNRAFNMDIELPPMEVIARRDLHDRNLKKIVAVLKEYPLATFHWDRLYLVNMGDGVVRNFHATTTSFHITGLECII